MKQEKYKFIITYKLINYIVLDDNKNINTDYNSPTVICPEAPVYQIINLTDNCLYSSGYRSFADALKEKERLNKQFN